MIVTFRVRKKVILGKNKTKAEPTVAVKRDPDWEQKCKLNLKWKNLTCFKIRW